MKNSKYEFNKLFYKTGSFWFGFVILVGQVGDIFLKFNSKAAWLSILIMIIMFFNAFLKKKTE